MRLSTLALACLATLSTLPAGVRAETAFEQFERLANDPTNTDAHAYVEGFIVGPDLVGGAAFQDTDDLFGAGSIFLQRAAGGGLAETKALTSFGRFEMTNQTVKGESGTSANSNGGFRDVWTIGGGSGTGNLEVRGVIEGSSSGEAGDIETNALLGILGSGRPWDARAGASMVSNNGDFSLAFDCRKQINSSCGGAVADGKARAYWSLTVPFEYGDSLTFAQRMFAFTGSNFAESGVGVQTDITGIVLPDGATLTAASNHVVFSDGVWVYTDRVPLPIPEPATWGLMLAGLGALLGLGSRNPRG